jgi:hypothetical protein
MDPLNQASAGRAHVGHTHDPFPISSLQFESNTWFFHHSDVVDFVDGLASTQAHEVQYLCGRECLFACLSKAQGFGDRDEVSHVPEFHS